MNLTRCNVPVEIQYAWHPDHEVTMDNLQAENSKKNIFINIGSTGHMFTMHYINRKKNSLEDLINEIPVRCMSYIFYRIKVYKRLLLVS